VFAAELVLAGLSVYLLAGLMFGLPFVLRGAGRVDAAARGASLGFRLLILPGTAVLWPLLLAKWFRAVRAGALT
jgi:hypothetical protein